MRSGTTAPASIDEYITSQPREVQAILQTIRETIRSEVPEGEEAMRYGLPTFRYHGNLVHFGAFQKHIGFYPTPSGTERFQAEIQQYRFSKGAIQFPLDQPIPYDLIREIVRFRVQEVEEKAAKSQKDSQSQSVRR